MAYMTGRLLQRVGAGILGISVMFLTAGYSYSTETEQKVSELSVIDNGHGKHAVISSKSSTDNAETLSRKLIIANGACFYATARNAAPTLLIFPSDTKITHDGRPAIELEGKRYFVGAHLKFTGTEVTISDDQRSQISPCSPHGNVFQVTGISR
ncbi:hypothetical protein [Halomonas sp. PR-M31]|uniref:hypothetical protein n=1 Tax=Halomonas sp. PR-M31 TaxID=1471202 RepID=UPI000651BC9D|nr:hypothetical protein [Halomonas sp. PR-M31]